MMMLEIKNLTKAFGKTTVISDFSYSFAERGLYALVGESGSGKTTLMRLISGIDTDFSGEINGGGKEATSLAFQEKRLFPNLSALNNVLEISFSSYSTDDRSCVLEKFRQLGFSDSEMNLYPSELSGGMRQRVSFLRALMRNTPILLLDEPTKELDDKNRRVINDMIKAEAQRRLVIISTHNADDLAYLSPTLIHI